MNNTSSRADMTHRNPQDAFDQAIAEGRLSADEDDTHYAGNYMYMGTVNGCDTFKHIDTRQLPGIARGGFWSNDYLRPR